MTREEAIQWLKVINTKEFGWDEFALQESQREIRERCEQGVREAIDMAIEALQTEGEHGEGVVAYVCDNRKCGGDCDNCGRTTDIAHAKNFTRISDSYFERLDSVSVVRCKDCRWWNGETNGCKRNPSVEAWYETDFCKYGERKEP